jgi:adenylosuccinate synthase
LTDEIGNYMQERGCEFGATTGRRRRCGWLDLVAVKDAARLNGLTSLSVTKLDVLTGLKKLGKTHKGAVERANFVVLRSPDVPSMLVETAFISNPGEERKLNDPSHRSDLARAILDGVNTYFERQPPPGTLYAARAEAAEVASTAAGGR